MPEPVLAFGQAKAGVVRVGKWLTVTFPSAALGKTMVQTQEGDWKVGGHCKKKKKCWAALGLQLQDWKEKKRISKYFTQGCSAGIYHEGLVVCLAHEFTSMSGKLFLILYGCFCPDDWV